MHITMPPSLSLLFSSFILSQVSSGIFISLNVVNIIQCKILSFFNRINLSNIVILAISFWFGVQHGR